MIKSALEALRRRSLPMLLEQAIERVILDGEFAPGDRINEKELAHRFGTSRSPVREALRSLEAGGLIEQIPNRGVFVRRLDPAQVAEFYEVRAVLFGHAGELLATRASRDDIARLEGFVDDMDAAIADGDHERYVPLNFAFHDAVVQAAGNSVLAQQYASLVRQVRLYRIRNLSDDAAVRASNLEHREMVAAIAARDPARSRTAHLHHVEQAKLRLLAAIAAQDSAPGRNPAGETG